MNVRSRDKTEIIASILESTIDGATKSKMMYRSMVGMARINKYLPILIENSLLSYSPKSNTYVISEKGMLFLRIVRTIESLLLENRN